MLNEPIEGAFYHQEFRKAQLKEKCIIEKILNKWTSKRHVEHKVKFKSYPSEFDQRILSSDYL